MTPAPLSPYHFRQIANSLKDCGKELGSRQIALHRANGDFTDKDCDAFQRIVDGEYLWLY